MFSSAYDCSVLVRSAATIELKNAAAGVGLLRSSRRVNLAKQKDVFRTFKKVKKRNSNNTYCRPKNVLGLKTTVN